ncbi:mediator of RNA polymerase II transcription subunit 17 [Cladorrhinum samala]|uniref:Mediator of RNA polymerase II transcription subunit 17 n=1 Tax=Cladorrhinum samala TaxID=585594 RepID=A0AAV9HJI1_9PEZI|nr:mediator of RNA polymerase II transcription subunit 17 [Cladorrhinum samala]
MSDRPLGLRPQPKTSDSVNSVAEFHRRMAMQPGGFRALNQADLRRQIEAQASGAGGSDVPTAHSTEASEAADAPPDIARARDEIINMGRLATKSAGMLLDTVSLLLSKENPTSAATTLRADTRQLVGLGTLGATRLAAPTTLTQERIPYNKMASIGQRRVDLNKAASAAAAAAKRLRKEIDAEAKYWSEVQTLADAGFRLVRLPEESTMGVKFGFNSQDPDFVDKDIAPLRRAEDGSVELVLGAFGGGSQRIQVSILQLKEVENEKEYTVVGRSRLPAPLPEAAPLKDRVKEASETAFNQELWHEINKEGRLMLNREVRLEKAAVTYPISPTEIMSIALVSLGGADVAVPASPMPKDNMAEALNIALALQLISAHRLREEGEGENEMHDAMHVTKEEDDNQVEYLLLEPIVASFEHDRIVDRCVRFFSDFLRPLCSAGLESFVEIKEKPLTFPPAKSRAVAATCALLTHPDIYFGLQITPQARLGITCSSSAIQGTRFVVSCEPASRPELANPLPNLCPPYAEGYEEVDGLFLYIQWAVSRGLAAHSKLILQSLMSSIQMDGQAHTQWVYTPDNKGLVDNSGDYGIHFEFASDQTGGLAVHLTANLNKDGQKISKEWTWPPHTDQSISSNLEDVVREVLSGCPNLTESHGL